MTGRTHLEMAIACAAINVYNAIIAPMASITVRNLNPQVKARIRIRAARHARSMEEEVRVILSEAVASDSAPPTNLAAMIASRFKPLGGVELEIPPREPMREPPKFRR
jgi:plasmid stability protein